MPLDADHGWRREDMVTVADTLALLQRTHRLTPDPRAREGAPAERFLVSRPNEQEAGP